MYSKMLCSSGSTFSLKHMLSYTLKIELYSISQGNLSQFVITNIVSLPQILLFTQIPVLKCIV